MTLPLTVPPKKGHETFLYSPLVTDLDSLDAHVAVLGIPYGDPYTIDEVTNDQTKAPDAVRAATFLVSRAAGSYDFDLGGPIFAGRDVRMVDVGNVRGDFRDLSGHYRRAETVARKILQAGAIPVTLGGDHGVPIPVLRAYEGAAPITLVHIDAHLDFRDEVNGAREGYSSPIRRASEMAHIGEIFQIGLRSQGSARAEEVEAARAHGCHLIPAHELHDIGMKAVLERIPSGGRYYLTIDADGLDPSVMPAVIAPAPGGVTFHQMHTLIHGLARKGRLVGMDIVEITPSADVNQLSCLAAGRLIVNLVGASARAGYFDPGKTRADRYAEMMGKR
ncbi:MAG TPA: agmatinase [Stellaceae bacterium]|nr:agmatinase [Stellaceae bacterium]